MLRPSWTQPPATWRVTRFGRIKHNEQYGRRFPQGLTALIAAPDLRPAGRRCWRPRAPGEQAERKAVPQRDEARFRATAWRSGCRRSHCSRRPRRSRPRWAPCSRPSALASARRSRRRHQRGRRTHNCERSTPASTCGSSCRHMPERRLAASPSVAVVAPSPSPISMCPGSTPSMDVQPMPSSSLYISRRVEGQQSRCRSSSIRRRRARTMPGWRRSWRPCRGLAGKAPSTPGPRRSPRPTPL
mmetsp:Transcript_52522/g.151368  ORF Transcript_52522/g.151368 Transcript_52522/m.151368 type:complete len:243 (-) Transcript_52522:567-1295(-)